MYGSDLLQLSCLLRKFNSPYQPTFCPPPSPNQISGYSPANPANKEDVKKRTTVRMVMSPIALVFSMERVLVVKSMTISPLFIAVAIAISSPVAGLRKTPRAGTSTPANTASCAQTPWIFSAKCHTKSGKFCVDLRRCKIKFVHLKNADFVSSKV